MGRLFGTDGARGIANSELTCEIAMEIGRAAANVLIGQTNHKPTILIGKDTRISCDMLESALTAGLCSVGADVTLLGVIPTPAVAYLVKKYNADAGIMISASHNSCEYNGIKIFNNNGYKLPDALEEQIEAIVLDKAVQLPVPIGGDVGKVSHCTQAIDDYIEHITQAADYSLDGLKVAVDCANGSSSVTAERLLTGLGAEVVMLSNTPDGININENCGSTHLGNLQKAVIEHGCDCGVAFDGDADRCLAVDENGNIIDGDKMIAIFAKQLKESGKLNGNHVVVTVMTNLGFFKFAKREGIDVATTKVGDRYVLEEMIKDNYVIGGEQSGHIIFLDYATTGDGQLSAVKLLSCIASKDKKASEIAAIMDTYPQTLINIKVSADGKNRLDGDKVIWDAIAQWEQKMGDEGRILVRCSGTEPLIRVMAEGKDAELINQASQNIADIIKERLA